MKKRKEKIQPSASRITLVAPLLILGLFLGE
jgi:hypothetical protein